MANKPTISLSGNKFEDVLKRMLSTPPPPSSKKAKVAKKRKKK